MFRLPRSYCHNASNAMSVQDLANQSSSRAHGYTEDSEISTRSVEQEQAARGAFIEWLDLEYSANLILKQTN
ncbi:unnamed protein product [Penicillium nalgiovense]|nr:unnamed protein product [Penicillium nalgiovense]